MKINQLILEYSRDVTAQKLGAALIAKFDREPPQWQSRIVNTFGADPRQVLDTLLARVELADPTKNKQYVPWLIRTYTTSPNLKFEDLITKFSEPLTKFYKLVQKKQIPAPNNDIGRIKDLATLVQVVDQHPDVEEKDKDADRGQVKPYYEDADIRVIIPEDQKAACYYGQGTKWCTAARENNMFDRYNKSGEMYIIMPKKPAYAGEKYQFHFPTKQFMDEKDHRVNLKELRDRFPQLADIFAKQAAEFGVLALNKSMDNIDIRQVLPVFRETLKTLLRRDGRRAAREMAVEIAASNRAFKNDDEVLDLAEMFMEEDSHKVVNQLADIVQDEGVDVLNDEDALFDIVSEMAADIRVNSELWVYITEMLEELEDEESEFDCAMAIDGEFTSMTINLAPEALKEALAAVQRSVNNSKETK